MSSSKRFSVVLPVRNGGEHVKTCVASILAQTLADDFELLILENASTDGTAEWLAALRDERIRFHPADRPLSIVENWGRIKDLLKGEYLTTIGHDDLLDPEFLEVISGLIREHPDAGLYLAHFRLIDAAGRFLRHCRPIPARETAGEFLAARLVSGRDTYGTGYVMRSADYDRVGGIPPYHRLLYADDALWLHLMEGTWKATSPREVFSYRLHGESASGRPEPQGLLTALESYQDALDAMSKRDPGVRQTLERYGPEANFQSGEYLHKRFVLRALAGGGKYPADARARLLRVKGRCAGGPGTFQRRRRLRWLERVYHLPGGRWLYRAARALAAFAGEEYRLTD